MAKFYSLQFGSGDPRTYAGMSPTFLIFVRLSDGATIAPPAITQSLPNSGIYQFSYGVTQPIAFLADAATTSPGNAGRYIQGQIDPVDRMDEVGISLMAYGATTISYEILNQALGTSIYFVVGGIGGAGNTSVALGTTIQSLIGSIASAIGDSVTSPTDLFGYLKRTRELYEGQEQFIKGTGTLTMYDRTGATTLVSRTVTNNSSLVIKS